MDEQKSYITLDKKSALETELVELQGPKRKEVLEAVKSARAMGDLKENAEYHQAREEQARLESRIKEIETLLRKAEIVSSQSSGDEVAFGSEVWVLREGESEEKAYTIVGAPEANMSEGKVSNVSPLGSALFGKKVGEVAIVSTPRGDINYKVKKIT